MAFLVVGGVASANHVPDEQGASREVAETTIDMIEESHDALEHLDAKLSSLENVIKSGLGKEVKEAFEFSAALFRRYRDAESEVAYLRYGGGSMRGMAANAVSERLTRDRIDALAESGPETRWVEDGRGGWRKAGYQ